MTEKPSPAQRRKAAISAAFSEWYLTDGMTSPALHIAAAFRSISELSTIRAYLMRGRVTPSQRRIHANDALHRARFNLASGRRSSPLP